MVTVLGPARSLATSSRATKSRWFLDFLQSEGVFDTATAKRAAAAIAQSREPLESILLELGLIEEHRLLHALGKALDLELASPSELISEPVADDRIQVAFLKQTQILPLEISETTLTLATAFPLEDDSARALSYDLDRQLVLKLAPAADISRQLQLLDTGTNSETINLDDTEAAATILDADAERLRDLASEAPIIRLLNRLVAQAVDAEASDIHIEPLEDSIRVRFRIDGALQSVERLDRSLQMGLTSRIKILSRLNIAEQRLPQDGRIRLAIKGKEIDFRVSTSPTLYGESVVLRILDRRELALNFAALGFSEQSQTQLKAITQVPNGIFLVTGPTGSGKTTTLYAALAALNRSDAKLFTVEDPIEYHLKGVNQILVKPQIGLDFANILRSILRQDPDIIMVGEIRDGETAKIAVQAALTGHLVLSTLHTNSAAASITRLRDIGVDSFLLAATMRGILAQRLVRKLCPRCKKPAQARAESPTQTSFEAVGCPHCAGTGYRGRTVVYELLEETEAVRQAIIKEKPESDIETIARSEGMTLLRDSARLKIEAGDTSLEEVRRVLGAAEI
jgi:general secretion pathway protein E